MLTKSQRLARQLFKDLEALSADPPGVTRAAYGAGEQHAHDLMTRTGEALGCAQRVDAAGNLYMTFPGRDRARPATLVGSHLDSVPHGGNYDGAAGVVAGLATAAAFAEAGRRPVADLTVMAIRAEEAAWFPLSYLGSRAALGRLGADELDGACRSDTGRSLAWHMTEAGFDPTPLRAGQPQLELSRIGAFIEVHIEQGPQLIERATPLGLVTGMNGGFRHTTAVARGQYGHSGATPRHLRRDAVLGFADLAAGLERTWNDLEAAGQNATITFGTLATDPTQHAGSKVAGEVRFCLDVRSGSATALAQVRENLHVLSKEIAQRRGVEIDLGPGFTWPIVPLSDPLTARLGAAADALGIPTLRLASGAGHDAATFAQAGVPSAMIFLRNANGSHNPAEQLDPSDLDQAVRVLVRFLESD
ncbi:MAG: Zn-dependent hydrolase [Pseudomonadota bacterium]